MRPSQSLWREGSAAGATDALPDRLDTIIVGGGLTGLATALLLARAGQQVAVCEARSIGAVTSGHTTAKLSLLQGTRLSTLASRNPDEVVHAYLHGNQEGQSWLRQYLEMHRVDCQVRPAFTYATTDQGLAGAQAELAIADRMGLSVRWDEHLDLPFPTRGGVRLDDQVQVHPMEVLAALAADVRAHGGVITEGCRVLAVRTSGGKLRVITAAATTEADHVVLATGIPILDRAGFFSRLSPQRSYAAVFASSAQPPRGMYLSADDPTRSIRAVPMVDGTTRLLTGGNGHVVGRHPSPRSLVEDLTSWTEASFPGARLTHWWSAQDYLSADGLPYVGPLLPGKSPILVATGYAKWGMTNGVAAALALSGRILGGQQPWAAVMDSWRLREVGALPRVVGWNGLVAGHLARGWTRAAVRTPDPRPPAEGAGRVERRGIRPVGVCTVGGRTRAVSAVCPHLKGILTWNDAELSWDCPLHGSRFTADGSLLEGPATRSLPRAEASR